MLIRRATSNDVFAVSKLWLKFIAELSPDKKPRVDWYRERLHKNLATTCYAMFVAENNGVIIGYVDTYSIDDPACGKKVGMDATIYIEPEYRKTSVAGRLYAALSKWGRENNAEVITVTVRPGSEVELMYRVRGYEPVALLLQKNMGVTKCPFVQ